VFVVYVVFVLKQKLLKTLDLVPDSLHHGDRIGVL